MKKHFIRNRRVRWGGIAAVLTVLVIAVTVLTNAVFGTLAKRYGWYKPMNATPNYDVTETCYALLGDTFSSLSANGHAAHAEIIFCDTAVNLQADSTMSYLYHTATSIAEKYPENVTVTCHDIWTNPVAVKQYKTTVNPTTGETVETALKSTSVIVVAPDYHRVYALEEFFVFEDGNTEKLWAYNGEKKLAAGIIRAIDPEEHVVALTNNHGEIFYDYELLYLLDDAGYTVTYLDLYKDPIPENCDLIISYNPNSDLVEDELSSVSEPALLDEFLSKDGNSFWVFLENGTPDLVYFEKYLEGWGVDFGYHTSGERSYRYMVQDSTQTLTSDGYTIYGTAVRGGHSGEMLEALDSKVVFKNATAIQPAAGFLNNGDGSYTKGERTMYSLYEGGTNAVSWANGKAVASAAGNDAILMSLSTQKKAGATSHVGVVTSVDFSAEEFLQSAVYGNTDALMRILKTTGKTYTPEGLTIKPFEALEMSTVTTREMLWWTIGLAVTPAVAVTAIAVIVLVKRRNA